MGSVKSLNGNVMSEQLNGATVFLLSFFLKKRNPTKSIKHVYQILAAVGGDRVKAVTDVRGRHIWRPRQRESRNGADGERGRGLDPGWQMSAEAVRLVDIAASLALLFIRQPELTRGSLPPS